MIVEQNQNASWFGRHSLDCSADENLRQLLVSLHNLLARSACWRISAIKRFELRHELALFSFTAIPRTWFPIFAGARVYPHVIRRRVCRWTPCLASARCRRAFTNVFLVGFDPVGRYLALGGLEVQLASACEPVKLPFKRIFRFLLILCV
jgi:hypothetical protein